MRKNSSAEDYHKLFKEMFRELDMAEKDNADESIGSEKNKGKSKPSWVKIKPEEMEKIILDLAKEGESPSKIGMILRDKYGLPRSKLLGKKIGAVIKEKKGAFKTERDILEDNIGNLKEHISKNKKDYSASRSLTKKLWTMSKLQKI